MIKSMCNKAALMHEGQLVAVGLVDDIYEQYKAMVDKVLHAGSPNLAAPPGCRAQ